MRAALLFLIGLTSPLALAGQDTAIVIHPESTGVHFVPSELPRVVAEVKQMFADTVTGADDAIPDGNVAYAVVTAAAVSTDPGYTGVNAADVSVTNTDNDSAGTRIVCEISGGPAGSGLKLWKPPVVNAAGT